MAVPKNLLVVEDNQEWCDGYIRAAEREGFDAIKIAQDLDQAELLIEDMQFAVAFIDIGLNVSDDRNIDGIRVMEKIRKAGDPTSIVVVTGRSGRDVLPITRDAIKKYGALDIVRKAEIEPRDIRRLLNAGLEAFDQGIAASGLTVEDALRGDTPRLYWEDLVLRTMGVRGGVAGLHDFLEELLGPYLPMLRLARGEAAGIDTRDGVAHGAYWSRSVGTAVAICFGGERAAAEIDLAKTSGTLAGQYEVGGQLRGAALYGLTGAVFAVNDTPRGIFDGTG